MAEKYVVEGRVFSRLSAGVGGLKVEVVDKQPGADDAKLGEGKTDAAGRYKVELDLQPLQARGKKQPDLQARVSKDNKFLGASDLRYDASAHQTLDVLLPDAAAASLQSEHDALLAAIGAHFKGKLRDLKETEDRQSQDITHLAHKTGWDARMIALASLADKFAAPAGSIDASFFYALFRAGVGADEKAVYRTDPKAAAEIWTQAIDKRVIPAGLKASIAAATASFATKVREHALTDPAPSGLSSLKDMLALSLGNDAAKLGKFAELRASTGGDLGTFWQQVRIQIGAAEEKRLRLDGQLGQLTLNNAPLIAKVHQDAGQGGLKGVAALAQRGYYRADKWQAVLGQGAVPPEIPGANDAEKRTRYAEILAAKVRLNFPTGVVADMVRQDQTRVSEKGKVTTFLTEHQEKFDIGAQPVEQYIRRNQLQVDPEVTKQVKRIQRVYQITPDDQAMNALLASGLDSAYAVVRYGREQFIRAFKDKMGGEDNARLAYAKAQQVHSAVLNIAASYVTAANGPAIGVHSPAQIVDPAPVPANVGDVIAYATLEKLFGSMDYCACEHCRSVLGPAAYLVDLLHFLDRSDEEWAGYIANWKADHGNVPYPFPDQKSWDAAGRPMDRIEHIPLKVLNDRRPDIQNLPLTCENTNTPLPYIDLVNETLEYYVTNRLSLGGYLGHDTGDAKPAELAASPRFDVISHTAYNTVLAAAKFPAPLPFNQPLENLRRYFRRFETPLAEVMEALRKNDNVERPADAEYGWRDIWMETLGISREEYALLTDRTISVKELYGFPPATADADVLAGLSKAQKFARRLGIEYEQLFEILKTRFVNPSSTLIARLERLHLPFSAIKKVKDNTITPAEFEALLPQGLDRVPYDNDVRAWLRDNANYGRIMGMIGVSNPLAEGEMCKIDQLELRYANPDNAANRLRAFEFVRVLRFIRLWKRLGWSIEHTDKAIAALYPADKLPEHADDAVNLRLLDEGFMILLPRLGVLRRVMDALGLKPERDLAPLLACFAPIDTHGESSLYRHMFLRSAFVNTWPAFRDNGYGQVLTDNANRLLEHSEALRAAFQLREDEFALITSALGFDATTILTLENVSAVFRRGWLAKKLRLSVREFLLLTTPRVHPQKVTFTGIDPFAAPDAPSPPILKLIELTERLRAVALKPAAALYLAWNQDLSGKSAPQERALLEFARTLRAGLAATDAEFDLRSDPDGEIARARMALAYGNEATDKFFGLLGATLATDVPYSHAAAELEQPILDAGKGALAYDAFRRRLIFNGLLTKEVRDALAAVNGVSAEFKAAVGKLFDRCQGLVKPLFDRYPELRERYAEYVGSPKRVEERRSALLANFLPALRTRRKQQQALHAAAAAARADAAFAVAVLNDKNVLHAAGGANAPALDDFTAVERAGLSAKFFFRATATGAVGHASDAEADLAYSATGKNKLPNAGNAVSGIWTGYLEVPENGLYNFQVLADAGAGIELVLGGGQVRGQQNGELWDSAEPVELKAGTPLPFSLKVENVKQKIDVRWQIEGRGRETIPARFLYPETLTGSLRVAYVRFLKTVALAAALKLTAAEIAYFAAHPDYRVGGKPWLNQLPVSGDPDNATAAGHFKALGALLDFARIKAELSPDDERLLDVLRDPAAVLDGGTRLLALTQWEQASLDALLLRFGQPGVAALKDFGVFRRIYDAYGVVRKMGVSAVALAAAATNKPHANTVRGLQAALRARHDEADWLNVLKPVNDEMRSLQRDALVAYILNRMSWDPGSAHIDTADKLFEYFLMDVQMDPCAPTSRVRHALSSVQLFIDRCLMNLEARVSAAALSAKQWAWMKRYRVWEANRKIFLYPENWLEPELRDDQSPFFKEAMSELLQSDISEDSAAAALLNYLSKLEEVAKLEPCGIHYVDNGEGTDDDVAHVVARTGGAKRKYFYRRMQGGNWMPWEHIKLDIEDNPVYPVVWKDRLFVFWFKLIKEAPADAGAIPGDSGAFNTLTKEQVASAGSSASKMTVKAVLCWSERYNGKWQPTRTSDIDRPVVLGEYSLNGFDRSSLEFVRVAVEPEGALVFMSMSRSYPWFSLFNTYSLPFTNLDGKTDAATGAAVEWLRQESRGFAVGTSDKLTISYNRQGVDLAPISRSVLTHKDGMKHRVVGTGFAPQATWDKPFLFADSRHVFWVTTTRRMVPVTKFEGYVHPPLKFKPEDLVVAKPFPLPEWRRWTDPGWVDPVGPWVRPGGDLGIGIGGDFRVGIGGAGIVRFGGANLDSLGAVDLNAAVRGGNR